MRTGGTEEHLFSLLTRRQLYMGDLIEICLHCTYLQWETLLLLFHLVLLKTKIATKPVSLGLQSSVVLGSTNWSLLSVNWAHPMENQRKERGWQPVLCEYSDQQVLKDWHRSSPVSNFGGLFCLQSIPLYEVWSRLSLRALRKEQMSVGALQNKLWQLFSFSFGHRAFAPVFLILHWYQFPAVRYEANLNFRGINCNPGSQFNKYSQVKVKGDFFQPSQSF